MKRLISVVMPAFNAESTIAAAISSILSQSVESDFELLVVDDGSQDRTVQIVESFEDSRVQLTKLAANFGRAEARNVAIGLASGRFIVIADADDVSLPNRLEVHQDSFRSNRRTLVSGGQLRDLFHNVLSSDSELTFPETPELIDAEFRYGRMGIAHPACAFLKSWFDDTGGYDSGLTWCEDYDLLARGWRQDSFHATSQPLIGYRRRTKITDWAYWWENQRHVDAINHRLSSTSERRLEAIGHIGPFLRNSSTSNREIYERVRYWRYRSLLASRALRRSIRGTK